MALTQITFGMVGDLGTGQMLPALIMGSQTAADIVPTDTNQVTTITAPSQGRKPCCRIATDTAVYVAIGADPDAAVEADRLFLPAGAVEYVMCAPGDKAAVVEVSEA